MPPIRTFSCLLTGVLSSVALQAQRVPAKPEAWCAPATFLTPLSRPMFTASSAGGDARVVAFAPGVPPPIERTHPTNLAITLETRELVLPLSGTTSYTFWTFGGTVPGPFIRVREGDTLTLRLTNAPDSTVAHSIDLHAVTGSGGGASLTQTAPGEGSEFTFRALRSGLYVYHCATAPVPVHVANGMYGLILVEPPGGLPRVDREYYVMQSEFYTSATPGQPELLMFDSRKASDGRPTHVVFNGGIGVLAGDQSLRASVGETVRLFVGNGGPSLLSSFHTIGEIFDRVYQEGGALVTQRNVQTTVIPPGGAAIVEFAVEVPGTYLLVDHSLFLGMNKGAVGQLIVDGPVLEAAAAEPAALPGDGGEVRLRVGQRADLLSVSAQVTFPDQTQLVLPMTWQSATDSWERSVILPPNTGSTSMVYSVKWIARDAFGQSSQTGPTTITVGPSGTRTFQILDIRSETGGWRIRWSASDGRSYQLQATMRLWPVAWEDVGTITVATAEQASLWIEGASTGQKFFRVIER
jgi:nitrite reductase (NO-forming)